MIPDSKLHLSHAYYMHTQLLYHITPGFLGNLDACLSIVWVMIIRIGLNVSPPDIDCCGLLGSLEISASRLVASMDMCANQIIHEDVYWL